MNRKIDAMLLLKIAKNIKYIPTVIRTLKNWPMYLLYYLGIRKGGGAFVFRNGVRLCDEEGTASGTIAVVFIRKHYGSVVDKLTVVDIGANIGTFSIYAASSDSGVRLYAYEPIPANYEILLKNIADNGYQSRITAFNMGVASKTEKRKIYLISSPEHSLFADAEQEDGISVDCLSLNDVIERNGISKIDLLKINAEGAEYEILYSAPRECFEKIDEIRLEYHEHETDRYNVDDLLSFLEQRGYTKTYFYEHKYKEGFVWLKKAN